MQRAREIGGSAAVAATDLQHLFIHDIGLGRHAVIELDVEPVGLVALCERQCHRRVFLVTNVEEYHVIRSEQRVWMR